MSAFCREPRTLLPLRFSHPTRACSPVHDALRPVVRLRSRARSIPHY
jgi:hypothetical protein